MKTTHPGIRLAYLLLSVILLFYGLIMARDFLYPLAIGILISYLLFPWVNYLEKKGFPRILAILTGIVIAAVFFVFFTAFILKRFSLFLDDLPTFREKTISHLNSLQLYLESTFEIPSERLKNFLLDQIFSISTKSAEIFSATTHTVFTILMQPVFVFLFLYYRTKFAYFILKLVGREKRAIAVVVLREISKLVTRYMMGVATVVLVMCFINSIGYWIIGIRYFLLLGIIASMCSFIPYFGTFIGGAITFTFALLTEDSGIYALRVAIFVYVVHFIENNILTPNIVGHNVRINPFVIILSLIASAMIWGVPGMIIVIPFLAMLYVVIKKIPGMESYAYLIGTSGTRKHALTAENVRKFMQNMRNNRKNRKARK